MVELLWLIPALPLAGFAVLLLFGKRIGEPLAGWLGTAVVALSFLTALIVFAGLWNEPEHTYELTLFNWIPAGNFSVDTNRHVIDSIGSRVQLLPVDANGDVTGTSLSVFPGLPGFTVHQTARRPVERFTVDGTQPLAAAR